jgi:hypothetical protein
MSFGRVVDRACRQLIVSGPAANSLPSAIVRRGILIIAFLLAGCTAPVAAPPATVPPAMTRHRVVLPDGDWPVLIDRADPVAGTVTFTRIALSGPPPFHLTPTDPAVRTMTATVPGGAPGPYLITTRRGRIVALHRIARA